MTEVTNKLKAQRGGLKTSVTKLLPKIDEALANSDVDYLEIALVQLSEKEKQIVELDKLIQNEIVDCKQIETDVETAQDYRDKIILYKIKMEKVLKNVRKEEKIVSNDSSSMITRNMSQNSEAQIKVKLPKIHIEKFDGNPENFQEFWSQYKNAIHDNQSLNEIDKFTYLKSLLKSKAQLAIQGLSLSEKNYDLAVKILEERYGKKEILIRSHINNLLNLSPIRNTSNLKDLRELYDTCEIQIRSLESLDIELESYGNLLFPIITKLIPDSLILNYNRENKNETESWNVVKLLEYLKTEIEIRERTFSFQKRESDNHFQCSSKHRNETEFTRLSKNNFSKMKYHDKHPSAAALNIVSNENKCIFCSTSNNDHKTEECKLSVADKKQSLLRQGRCFNCLLKFHIVSRCIKKPACSVCNKKHSPHICDKLLEAKPEVPQNETIVSSITENRSSNKDILLQTATVFVENKVKRAEVRLLLDLGSQRSFIESELAKELKLKVVGKETIKIYPFGSREPKKETINRVQVNLINIRDPTKKIRLEALTTNTISNAVIYRPEAEIRNFCDINNIQLADEASSERLLSREENYPKVRLLVGADNYWNIVYGNVSRIPNSSLVAMDSVFGWVLSGSSDLENKTEIANEAKIMKLVVDSSPEENSDLILQKFWRLDAIGIENEKKDFSSSEGEIILQDFEKNIKFQNNRYKVKLPWNENAEKLENNYEIAKYRLDKLVKRFDKDKKFYERYKDVLSKQICEGIVEPIQFRENADFNIDKEYYMPHHAVIRDDKITTKLRIVFDASSHSPNKLSLNDCLHSGPNLNPDSLKLLLDFREKPVVLIGDIEQAFLQVLLDENDRDAVRFLWIENDNEMKENLKTKIFRMTRVLFGATPSPFLLAATLKYHIKKYKNKYPVAYQILDSQLYVDDLISGLENENQCFEIYKQIKEILLEGGFNMRKWKTNSGLLQLKLNQAENCKEYLSEISKVLGYIWNSNNDTLKLECEFVKFNNELNPVTKRLLLKIASKLYDPIGFITPFTLRPKILLQDIWERKLKWDDPLPIDLTKEWNKWYDELEDLSKFEIPRFCLKDSKENKDFQFHCFVDASKKAYGAVLYIRYTDYEGQFRTSLVCSKSRVAPLQKLTLPRLELLSAVIGTRLYDYVKNSLSNVSDFPIRFWSDSMIALHWIRGNSKKLKTFVQNRVTEIRSKSDTSCWSHCPGEQNPADVLTRGETLRNLMDKELWWNGPEWLRESEDYWPKESQEIDVIENDEEVKKSAVFTVDAETEKFIDIEKFGHLTKLLRITAWVRRFIFNLKNEEDRRIGTISTEELQSAEIYWIRKVQEENFREELEALKRGSEISSNSKLKNFSVILDETNIIRLRSRLQYADITHDEACPMLLPDRSHFTDLVIRRSHENLGHSGVSDTLIDVREHFWIIRGRQRIKSIIFNCNLCKKFRVKPFTQDEAPLPADRIKQTHPFEVTGIDYAGPLYVRNADGTKKAYILLFTCAVTRAVHLELTEDLTTKTFLLAFRKFISRRGLCRKLYSDNARTFKRAKTELNLLWKFLKEDEIQNYFANKEIEWNFIVERAAWWGGFWERLIRSTKNCLRRMLGRTSLTFPELETVVIEVEAIMNSRPLTFVYNDTQEPEPLTPGHFLIGRRLVAPPPPSSSVPLSTKSELKGRWKHKRAILERIWKKWQSSYLLELRSAHQCKRPKGNVEPTENSTVLVYDEKLPRLMWKMGIVTSVHPGRDGKVRACTIKLPNGTFLRRPVQLLYPVELNIDAKGPSDCLSNGPLGPEDEAD